MLSIAFIGYLAELSAIAKVLNVSGRHITLSVIRRKHKVRVIGTIPLTAILHSGIFSNILQWVRLYFYWFDLEDNNLRSGPPQAKPSGRNTITPCLSVIVMSKLTATSHLVYRRRALLSGRRLSKFGKLSGWLWTGSLRRQRRRRRIRQ